MYIYNFLFRISDIMSSQNIDLSSWDIPYCISCRFVAMALFSVHYKFHIPSSSISLVIMRLRAKYKTAYSITLLFYIPQRETLFQKTRISADVAAISFIRAASMLLPLILANKHGL
jgi:hypothetical protein